MEDFLLDQSSSTARSAGVAFVLRVLVSWGLGFGILPSRRRWPFRCLRTGYRVGILTLGPGRMGSRPSAPGNVRTTMDSQHRGRVHTFHHQIQYLARDSRKAYSSCPGIWAGRSRRDYLGAALLDSAVRGR